MNGAVLLLKLLHIIQGEEFDHSVHCRQYYGLHRVICKLLIYRTLKHKVNK